MKVLQVCAFGAPNPGNFIASLLALDKVLKEKNIETIYAFVERAKEMDWCKELQKHAKVYFLPEAKARILPATYSMLRKIYSENDIKIVHSHFELYDIPATVTAPKGTKIFWHLHDPINGGTGLRKIIWKLQYGVFSKRAFLLSVADNYRKVAISMGFPEKQTAVVLNSIDLDRIKRPEKNTEKEFDFITFGWDFYRKGDDIILSACQRLADEGYHFRFLLNGLDVTWKNLSDYYGGKPDPEFLIRGKNTTDISSLFSKCGVFIQASRRETFSYAVCEAAYFGLPVITSDIPGLEWAHELPSVKFFESENCDELYRLMKSVLDGEKPSENEIKKTQNVIKDNYSIDVWVNDLIRFYGV